MQINTRKKKTLIKRNQKGFPFYGVITALTLVVFFALGGLFYEAGLHTQLKMVVQGRVEELPDGSIKELLQELYGMIKSETVAYTGNNLSTLYLDIPFENLQILQQKREEALETGILLASDDDYVSATVRYNDSAPIDIELRLKGDWTDHLEGDKWSYRIHIKDDAAIEGMTRFSIQSPETRNFIYEWAYHQTLIREGLLAPRYFFVNVIENGENKGIFAMEESFYTELIESEQRRSGIIVRFNEDDMWQNWSTFFSIGKEDMRTAAGQSGYFMQAEFDSAAISSFGQGKIMADPVLLAEYRAAQDMLRNYQSEAVSDQSVFDMEQMGKFIAITELWGAGHALAWHNLRFYYNPVTNLLEPIAFDGIPMSEPYVSVDFAEDDPGMTLLDDSEMRRAFFDEAASYLDEDFVASLEAEYSEEINRISASLANEYPFDTSIDWQRMYEHQVYLQDELLPESNIQVSVEYVPESGYQTYIKNVYFGELILKRVVLENASTTSLSEIELNEKIPFTAPASDFEKNIFIGSEDLIGGVENENIKLLFEFYNPLDNSSFEKEVIVQN